MMKMIHRTPTIFQFEAAECGAASLAMILAFYGRRVSLEQLRIDAGVSRDGSKAGNLIRAAAKHGLEGHGFKKSFERLRDLQTPCILLLRGGHFVVLEGFKSKSILINDPAVGRRKLAPGELRTLYGGIVLTFERTADFEKKKPTGIPAFARRQIRLYAQGMALGIVLRLLTVACCCVACRCLWREIDASVLQESLGFFPVVVLLLSVLAAAGFLVLRCFVNSVNGRQFSLRSAKAFAEKLLRLPFLFFEQRYAGDPVGRSHRSAAVNRYISETLTNAVSGLTAALPVLFLMFYNSMPRAFSALAAATAAAVAPLLPIALEGSVARLAAGESVLAGRIYTGLCEMETLKAAGAEERWAAVLKKEMNKLSCARKRREAAHGLSRACAAALVPASVLLITVVCRADGASEGETAAFLLLFLLLLHLMRDVVIAFIRLPSFRTDLAAVCDVADYAPDELYRKDKLSSVKKADGAVALENVSFSYGALSPQVIHGLSLSVVAGGFAAIVGTSGSGKSTAAKLLGGVYRPVEGRVTLDHITLDKVQKSVINASVAIVDTHPSLFSGSVRDNITMWNAGISEKDIAAAIQDACIGECIERRGGLNAPVTENGANFSGGQRSRLALARALASNPSVLILDEATAALDAVTEQRIIENIRRRGCTCVMISHRLSAVRDCDIIFVLDNGRVVQQGTHRELAGEGVYRALMKEVST